MAAKLVTSPVKAMPVVYSIVWQGICDTDRSCLLPLKAVYGQVTRAGPTVERKWLIYGVLY